MEILPSLQLPVRELLGESSFVLSLLDTLACLVVLIDGEGRILHWNRICERVSGRTLEEARGMPLWEVSAPPPEERDAARELLLSSVRVGKDLCFDSRWVDRQQSEHFIAWSTSCLATAEGAGKGAVCTGMDVTGMVHSQEEARRAHRRVQEVLERLIQAQEEERRRVAFEVHDGLLQYVIAARMHLESLERGLGRCCPEEQEALGMVRQRIREAVSEGRRIIGSLRPATLDDFGLVETLRRDLGALRRETRWAVTFHSRLEEGLPPRVETNLYRIFQEVVHNARRHSKTRRLLVELEESEGEVRLRIRDWGRGFGGSQSGGLGLETLRERAEIVGGRCRIETMPGEGTTVEVSVPR